MAQELMEEFAKDLLMLRFITQINIRILLSREYVLDIYKKPYIASLEFSCMHLNSTMKLQHNTNSSYHMVVNVDNPSADQTLTRSIGQVGIDQPPIYVCAFFH